MTRRQFGQSSLAEALESRTFLSGLTIDPQFGSSNGANGKAITSFLAEKGSESSPVSATLQFDGKIVVAGHVGSLPGANWVLQRFDSQGKLDTSFGTGGTARSYIDSGLTASSVAQQADGKLLVGGSVWRLELANRHHFDPVLARYNVDGSLDTSFGSGGFTTSLGRVITDVVPLADGKILTLGGPTYLTRYNADGTVDASFGAGGAPSVPLTTAGKSSGNLIVLSNGQMIVQTDGNVARYNADATRDITFNAPYLARAGSIARQSDGRLIVAQVSGGAASDVVLTRLNLSGGIDASFGTAGTTRISWIEDDLGGSLVVDSNDRILIGAYSDYAQVSNGYSAALSRLLPNGALDETFGYGGKFIDHMIGHDLIRSMVLTPGGELYVVGPTPAQTPATPGTYANVALRKYLMDVPITVKPGTYPTTTEGAVVTVADAGSDYARGSIVGYEWWISDDRTGQRVIGPNGTLNVVNSPKGQINLIVRTNDGLISYGSTEFQVINVPPTAGLRAPHTVPFGVSTALNPFASDAAPERLRVQLDFADGTASSSSMSGFPTTYHSPSMNHKYANRGAYTVTVTATDDEVSTSITSTINVVDIVVSATNIDSNISLPFSGIPVYIDANKNGQLDADEPVQISDSEGLSGFSGLGPGTYRVGFITPTGWNYLSPINGYADLTVTATAGAALQVRFTQSPVVAGTVFTDDDGDGVRDPNEPGRQYVSVVMDGQTSNEFVAYTDALGNYRLKVPSALDGTNAVIRIQTAGLTQTFPQKLAGRMVSVYLGQLVAGQDFGVQSGSGASIRGKTYNDLNGDGVDNDAYVSWPASTVFIDADEDGVLDPIEPRLTGPNYSPEWGFYGLTAGTYSVRMIPPPGYVQTQPAPGQAYQVAVPAGGVGGLAFGAHDIVAPAVVSTSFQFDSVPQQGVMVFTESVKQLIAGNFSVTNLTTGLSVPISIGPSSSGSTCQIRPSTGSVFADGNYRVTIAAGLLQDLSGNPLPACTFDFFVLAGDANRDARVDDFDMAILASNWQRLEKTSARAISTTTPVWTLKTC